MFYDIFDDLCKRSGRPVSKVRKDLGISQSTVASWKSRGLTPKAETLQRLSEYFNVSVEYLLGKKDEYYPLAVGTSLYNGLATVVAISKTPNGAISVGFLTDPGKITVESITSVFRACQEVGVPTDALIQAMKRCSETGISEDFIDEIQDAIMRIDMCRRIRAMENGTPLIAPSLSEDAPEPPAEASEGTCTTPPPEGTGGPPEGE